MRMTQYIGLNQAGRLFVKDLEEVVTSNETTGMFGEGVPLGEWRSVVGHRIKEIVQCEIWSSGPMIFTCIEHENGLTYCKWSEKDLELAT